MVQFTPLGGVGEVGANCYLLQIDDLQLILDSGLHPKKEGKAALPAFSYLKKAPHAAIISHAHSDHCGSLPYLLKLFPGVVPYATDPTIRIMDRMLHNSVSVMGILRDERRIDEYPLYEHSDVDYVMRRAYGIEMEQEFGVRPNSPVRVTFYPAGHVLGSAMTKVESPGHTLVYTADICAADQALLAGFKPPEIGKVNTLIIESTYGAKDDAYKYTYETETKRFGEDLGEVLNRGGTVLVPSFALGRSQEILNIIVRLQEQGIVPDVPVYASGLGRAIYEIYARFIDHLKPNTTLCPLEQFKRVGDVWDPEVARKLLHEPSIIVATSGMMVENTPSAMIAQEMVKEKRHGIFFVGYCDPDTLGYKVRTAEVGDKLAFSLGGAPVEIELETINWYQFSAHAPREDLQGVVDHYTPDNLIFVHGDPPAIEWMQNHTGDGCAKFAPEIGETVSLAR